MWHSYIHLLYIESFVVFFGDRFYISYVCKYNGIQIVILIECLYSFSYVMKLVEILSLPQPSGRVLFRDYATGDLAQVDLQYTSFLFSLVIFCLN